MKANVIELKGKRGRQERIHNAKWAYSTRRIPSHTAVSIVTAGPAPRAGDLVLARVARLGQHKRLELINGRKARLFVGDEVVVVYGNRYAPDQFEALIPGDLERCDLVAAGGIASRMTFKHGAMKAPTTIEPVGLLADADGKRINLSDFALTPQDLGRVLPPVIAVVGSSMNAGKTTTAANLVRGFASAGYVVAAGKVTGTGAGGDIWFMQDAGARQVADFIDAGHPSTYRLPAAAVRQTLVTLLAYLSQAEPDIIVIEIADGIRQVETADLLTSEMFAHHVDAVIYAAADALGAEHGVRLLRQEGLNVVAVGGVITRSPLSVREVQDAIDLPVLGPKVLRSAVITSYAAQWLQAHRRAMGRSGGRR